MPAAATRQDCAANGPMDITIINLALYLTATFAAAFVTGVAGFAFGLVTAAIWLHILTPTQTTTLFIAFGLVVQGISVWKLRHALQWRRLWPFLLGGALGVPLGVAILEWAWPDYVRVCARGRLWAACSCVEPRCDIFSDKQIALLQTF